MSENGKLSNWRTNVINKSNGCCVICGECGCECHHVVPKSVKPSLRFQSSNGVLLCKRCHKLVHGGDCDHVELLRLALDGDLKTTARIIQNIRKYPTHNHGVYKNKKEQRRFAQSNRSVVKDTVAPVKIKKLRQGYMIY